MEKIKKYLLLLCFFNIIALYTNKIYAQCPEPSGSIGSGAGKDKGGGSGGGGGTKGGGGGGGEDHYADVWEPDDDYDDGGMDPYPFYEQLQPKGPCTKDKAIKILLSSRTWEEVAQTMYAIDRSWGGFSVTGPITPREIAFFTKQRPEFFCNPSMLADAIKVLEIVKVCDRNGKDITNSGQASQWGGSVAGFDELTDYLRAPDQSQHKVQSEAQLRCYFSQVLGEEFSKCAFPAGQDVDMATVRNALAIDEYLKKNPQDKQLLNEGGCDFIANANALLDTDFWNEVKKSNDLAKKCVNADEWAYLGNFTPPASVINHVNSVGYIQTISNSGNGSLINLDYFGLEICGLPKKINGQEMTKEELVELIRQNISSFTETEFTPKLNGYFNDEALYSSNNPLGALVHIKIPGDNGSVVVSDYNSSGWIFSTVFIKGIPGVADGTHPVSGNRQFSMYVDANGKLQFFIKGADRITNDLVAGPLGVLFATSQADKLWETTIKNIAKFITDNGGCAKTTTPIKSRVNWSQTRECWKKTGKLEDCVICY